jgi:hypothetical protein
MAVKQYHTLLENAAASYDAQQQTASLRLGDDTRHVYMAQTDFFGDLQEDPGPWDTGFFEQDAAGDPDDFDMDVPLSTVTAFAAQQRSCPRPPPCDPAANLPSHIYGQLTSADKGAWSKLSNDRRRLIVSNLASLAMGSGIGGLTLVNRRVHHTSWYDPGALPPPLPPPPPAPDNTQLLTMMTDQRPAHHPGDVRRLLLSASAGSSHKSRERAGDHPCGGDAPRNLRENSRSPTQYPLVASTDRHRKE